MSRELYFEDVEIGDDIGPVERTVNKDQVVRFLSVHQGRDTGPNRFTSEEAAEKEGLPNAIVPGAMNIAMMSTLLTGWADTARLKKLDVVFRGMVPHNKILTLAGIVTDKNVVDGEARLECDVFLQNDEGTRLIIGNAIVLLPTR
ncbi:MAG: MaoC/PaaZ C-terminal domain-containing protein [Chloroflexi bacterium]|nr:MaoC/PaaZ C-terminal domain-containing protein [Chloroflexota bacterium]MDA1229009.1 MaoC/PaaZ C-terminal domain-containing protein [Chloroflexota bacterium]